MYERILNRAKRLIVSDRSGVVAALRYWLSLRHVSFTVIAIWVIEELKLIELKPELLALRNDIESGKAFLPYYVDWVDRAIKVIG